jgi:hypothetical protein
VLPPAKGRKDSLSIYKARSVTKALKEPEETEPSEPRVLSQDSNKQSHDLGTKRNYDLNRTCKMRKTGSARSNCCPLMTQKLGFSPRMNVPRKLSRNCQHFYGTV